MQQVKRTHAVRCPVCGKGRVIDAAADVDPGRLHLYGPEHADKAELFSKCPKCGLQIGISFEKAGHSYQDLYRTPSPSAASGRMGIFSLGVSSPSASAFRISTTPSPPKRTRRPCS